MLHQFAGIIIIAISIIVIIINDNVYWRCAGKKE